MEQSKLSPKEIDGRHFRRTLSIHNVAVGKPNVLLAESPYWLGHYEYGLLQRARYKRSYLFGPILGATLGLLISVIGKAIASILDKKEVSIQPWEMWAIAVGIVASVITGCIPLVHRAKEERQYYSLMEKIEHHFETKKTKTISYRKKEAK